MAMSTAKRLANAKYRASKRTFIGADVSKEKGAVYRAKAAALGMSLSQLIQRAIDAYNVDADSVPTPAEPALTEEQRKILDAVSNLSPQSQKALIKFLQTLKQDT